jgi:outer membrane protein OmpA-like peptidoglycan-associated protein
MNAHLRPWLLPILIAGLLACPAALADPVDAAAADSPAADAGIALQPGRPDGSRTSEPPELSQLQQRLDGTAAAASCDEIYATHKAQAWLNFGRYAVAEQLPREVQAAALANARTLLESLLQRSAIPHQTPELPRAHHVRDDLWRGIAAAEQDGRVCGAPKMTAYCEVQLAWVDYESGAGGWRHVEPYLRIAEDYCSTAQAAVPPPAAVVAPSLPAPAPAAPRLDEDLSVVFPHNRSARHTIREPGQAQLRELAARWQHGSHTTVHLIGHADLTGRNGYNLRLSMRRAQSVAQQLQHYGIPRSAMRIEAVGERQEVVQCPRPGESAERRRYLACLEPNRRVVVRIDAP